ncbi:hypothetical protein MNEG_3672 [Monoraphidium neglectum]|uniref:Tyrosine-protein kinase ephrin type A/B receptor-like domain-containing protein n=1 Tax=Monoraphidium neglectum TaxID=145388 RepID=A0A0D2NGX7_9CHLO|nr:hypothetical protein MNEG_3672 [Monoraphidium neglectum]KIZ04286.1 hypothetical protein MNEG_3672 [Monoraphidium neglectum]|eukprot:XP_013903305.1 hypothetical protein MNEG_3672 [Monoraphidium neglectum]
MASKLSTLLLLAAVLGAASASRAIEEPSGRQLLQAPTSADCDRSVKHCTACRYQFYRGTVTKAICTKCDTGYTVKASGRACYCAPGYYTTENTAVSGQTGFTCIPCDYNNVCPGAKITAESSTAFAACGANKITTTQFAKSDRECVVKPGFGWGTGDTSAACDAGFYNPGYNTRKCTKCPGDLTTLGTNSNSTQDCQAPIGSYYLRGKAVACARGTYKTFVGNQDCTSCPTGVTTVAGEVGKTASSDCTVLLPGYQFASAPTVGTTDATECAQDSYRVGEVSFDGSTAVTCTACGNNLTTLANVTKATSPDACLAPPGYGWAAGGTNGAGVATLCPLGSYNPGYNREPCVKCGNGTITTAAPGATSADQCYTPAGHGNKRDAVSGVLEGYECPLNTYGRPNNTFGLVDVECTKCLENTHTNQTASTRASQCLTNAGYGYDNGAVNQCAYGYYNPGDNQNPCTYCGDGFNTTNSANATSGELGSDAASDCKIDFGYHLFGSSASIEPCLRGFYKGFIGNGSCSQCPAGTSTTITMAAVAQTDCDTCRPGFGTGTADGKIALGSLSNSSCSLCASGTYSPGFTQGGANCTACPTTQNFTGTMVSRRGTFTPEDCFGQFITDPTNEQTFTAWDFIYHPPGTNLTYKSLYTSLSACQTNCGLDNSCQYMVFYKTGGADGDGINKCYWRTVGTDISAIQITGDGTAAWWDNPTENIVLFEIKEGAYVVYPKVLGETIGVTISLIGSPSTTNFKAMRTACDLDATCIGLTHDIGGVWRAFGGSLFEDTIGKIRVVGTAINSWIAEPTGTEENEGWSSVPLIG